jgi:hypothetical protein
MLAAEYLLDSSDGLFDLELARRRREFPLERVADSSEPRSTAAPRRVGHERNAAGRQSARRGVRSACEARVTPRRPVEFVHVRAIALANREIRSTVDAA